MEPYGAASSIRGEAQRWLSIAEKLLASRDFVGSKTFAIRARESDPNLQAADHILAVIDTLIAGDKRINHQHDWYAILQLPSRTVDSELVANQYRRLAITLNPHKSRLAFADEAFKLVSDAWSVLSNPSKKSIYDNKLTLSEKQFEQQQQQHARQNPRNYQTVDGRNETEQRESNTNQENSTFWTACPYCFHMYEYLKAYEDCLLRCQNCRRAFQAVKIPGPPVNFQGNEAYLSCWGFFPLGVSLSNLDKNKGGVLSWNPFSTMFPFPQFVDGANATDKNVKVGGQRNENAQKGSASAPRTYVVDDDDDDNEDCEEEEENDEDYVDAFVAISESSEESDDDWGSSKQKKKRKNMKGKGVKVTNARKMRGDKAKTVKRAGGDNLQGAFTMQDIMGKESASNSETSKKAAAHSSKKQKGKVSKEQGRLDLNVEFSNEVEEPAAIVSRGNGAGNNDVDGMEGIGFFDGLDEFWSNLPIVEG